MAERNKEALEEIKTEALADVEDEIEEVRVALDEAIEEFEASIAGLRERMTDLQEAILERLRQARNQVECGRQQESSIFTLLHLS
jgi:exonuclease VII small subunit